MIYTELGHCPLTVTRKVRIIKYWLKLPKTENCILKSIYEDCYVFVIHTLMIKSPG